MEHWQLKQRQGLPLEVKIEMSKKKIREFYDHYHGDVYVSFSGGKDSTVLLDLVRSIYPKVPAVFVDTGLEYPEIKEFVRSIDNVTWLRPKMSFKEVLEKYGYPVVSKVNALKIRQAQTLPVGSKSHTLRTLGIKSDGVKSKIGEIPKKWKFLIGASFKVSERCCDVIKKKPIKEFNKKTGKYPYVGQMAADSNNRQKVYLKNGCNSFDNNVQSNPLGFWLEQDVWDYIKKFNLPYSSIYDTGVKRTGCMFCMFGVHLEKTPNRFQRMAKTHPKLYDYCINKLGCGKVLDYIGVDYGELLC